MKQCSDVLSPDARLQRWIGQFGRAVLSKLRLPKVALDSLAIKRSEVNCWVAGETVPRHFEQVDAVMRLARDYQGLEMHLSGQCNTPAPSRSLLRPRKEKKREQNKTKRIERLHLLALI